MVTGECGTQAALRRTSALGIGQSKAFGQYGVHEVTLDEDDRAACLGEGGSEIDRRR